VEGLSIAEIATVMGRSPAAANSLLQRARAALFRRGQVYSWVTTRRDDDERARAKHSRKRSGDER
jgi:Sigma-70, region 4